MRVRVRAQAQVQTERRKEISNEQLAHVTSLPSASWTRRSRCVIQSKSQRNSKGENVANRQPTGRRGRAETPQLRRGRGWGEGGPSWGKFLPPPRLPHTLPLPGLDAAHPHLGRGPLSH